MASFVKFNTFSEALAEGAHDLGSDSLVIFLTNSAPTAATDANISDITEVSYTNCSSRAITTSSSAQTSGTYKLVLADVTLSASGGSVGPFRYVGIYNDTATSDEVVGYYDHGSSVTVASGEDYLIDFDGTNGVLTLA